MGEVSTDDHFAASLCVIVIVITLLLFFLQRYIAGHYSYSMTALKPMEAVESKGSKKFCLSFVYGVTFWSMLPQLTVILHLSLRSAAVLCTQVIFLCRII